MNVSQWQQFLEIYSIELIEADEPLINIPNEARQSRWMGFPPASEIEIAEAEQRIGKPLPPSLRNFYLVTNGWRATGDFIDNILPVSEVEWLEVFDPHLYSLAVKAEENKDDNTDVKASTSDLYSLAVKAVAIRAEEIKETFNLDDWDDWDEEESVPYWYQQGTQVKRSLVISSWGDAAIWLLDPGEDDSQGEWLAGRWASWNPAMDWYAKSFAELMLQELNFFKSLDR
jgi:hypothetical protein